MNIYKFRFYYSVLKPFTLPQYHGMALHSLLSGFKKLGEKDLNDFFQVLNPKHEGKQWRPYSLQPKKLEAEKHFATESEFYFDLLVYGNAISYLSEIEPFEKIVRFFMHAPEPELELRVIKCYTSELKSFPLKDSFSEALPYNPESLKYKDERRLNIEFVQPFQIETEKTYNKFHKLEFKRVVNSIINRYQGLHHLYNFGILPIQLPEKNELEQACAQIAFYPDKIEELDVEHHTQAKHLRRFVGNVSYSGNFAPFVPLLQWAQTTGIGKGTALGFGKVNITFEKE